MCASCWLQIVSSTTAMLCQSFYQDACHFVDKSVKAGYGPPFCMNSLSRRRELHDFSSHNAFYNSASWKAIGIGSLVSYSICMDVTWAGNKAQTHNSHTEWPTISLTLWTVDPSGVTRVGVTRGGNWGCHFFPEKKNWRLFLVIAFSQFSGVTHIYFLLKNWRPSFCSSLSLLLISLGCHPPAGCHPSPFFTCPTVFDRGNYATPLAFLSRRFRRFDPRAFGTRA